MSLGDGGGRQKTTLVTGTYHLAAVDPVSRKKRARRHLLKGPRSQGLPLPGDRKRRYLGNEVTAAGGRLYSFFEIYILELVIIHENCDILCSKSDRTYLDRLLRLTNRGARCYGIIQSCNTKLND